MKVNDLKKFSLPFVVFITGACVLVIEVVATRILSPYYGTTIFTVSSVISIVLAALSIGYYFGGKLADKHPTEKFFYSIILASGVSVIFMHLLVLFLLPGIGYSFSITIGPIIAAIILFLLPSLLLGTLSPFAVKLHEQNFPEKGVGSIAGEIFFWSTLGSIFGSLSAGFLLIPLFGIDQIIMGVSFTLLCLGLFPLLKIGAYKKKQISKIIFMSFVGLILVGIIAAVEGKNVVYSKDGVYEKIIIYDGVYAGRPARFFIQDRSASGAMFLDSNELAFAYTKYYVLHEIFNSDINNVLVIGGGAYSIPKALLRDLPDATVDVSEIEPSLFDLAQKYFALEKNERLHNYTEDGRRFLHDVDKKYDLIFSDVYYSLYSIPSHFTTQEFFELSKEKLNNDGIFMANLVGDLSTQGPSFIMSEMKTFRSVYPNSYFFAVVDPYQTGTQNFVFVGYKGEKTIDLTASEITEHENPIISSLAKKVVDPERFDLSSYPMLTDNYAPVEIMVSNFLRKSFVF